MRSVTIVAVAAAATVIGLLAWQNARLADQLDAVRGDLARARANVVALEDAITEQNAAVDALAAESRARQAEVSRLIATSPLPRSQVAEAMAAAPRGNTLAERVLDVDRRFMEALTCCDPSF